MKKVYLALILGLLAWNSVSAETPAAVPAQEKVTVSGELLRWQGGTMWLIGDETNAVRADLGKKGGRLLRHTPVTVTGTMQEDENGPYLVMECVEYADPDPIAEYMTGRRTSAETAAAATETEGTRDAAYFHDAIAPGGAYYADGKNVDTGAYAPVSAAALAEMETGTKAAVLGRAVKTAVPDEVVLFRDSGGTDIPVRLNGAYMPLGQRCTVYGTVQRKEGTLILSLDRVDSVA